VMRRYGPGDIPGGAGAERKRNEEKRNNDDVVDAVVCDCGVKVNLRSIFFTDFFCVWRKRKTL
jgi:hypothetical protein